MIEYPERLKKLCLQLTILLGLDVFAIQPNLFTIIIALRLDSFIVSLFLKFLGMAGVFLANNY